MSRYLKFKFELVKRVISKGYIRKSISMLFKIVRSKFFGHRYLVLTMTAYDSKENSQVKVKGYQVKQVSSYNMVDESLENSLRQYKHVLWWDWDIKSMLSKEGGCLWVGYLNRQLAHIAWTQVGDKVEGFFFPLTSDSVLIVRCETLPEYRGRGLYAASLAHIIRILTKEAFKQFYVEIEDWNSASIHGVNKVGFQLIGYGKCDRRNRHFWRGKTSPDLASVNRDGDK